MYIVVFTVTVWICHRLQSSVADNQQSYGTIKSLANRNEPLIVEKGTSAHLLHIINHGRNHKDMAAEYKHMRGDNMTASREMSPGNNSFSGPLQTHFQPVSQQDIADRCVKVPSCDPNAKYRSINGSCNNLKFPMWGLAGTALVRLVAAEYDDGIKKPRLSKSKSALPNVRDLRTSLLPIKTVPDHIHTLIVMEWGQIISHDTSHIITEVAEDENGPLCCSRRGWNLPSVLLPTKCLPIRIPRMDSFYSKFMQTCMNFVRATTTTDMGCILSPEQQVVSVSHFIDASFVYGSFDHTMRALRTFSGGHLRTKKASDGRIFPPNIRKPTLACDVKSDDDVCYFAGDDRINLNNDLTAIHIIMLREHNRLCDELHELNPNWNDETLYQEARRIVAAIVQRITYRHYLQILIGEEFMKEMELLDGDGDDDLQMGTYDEFLNPSTLNEFTTAAYRSFHSMITGKVQLFNGNNTVLQELDFSDFFLKPGIVEQPEMLDNFLRGLRLQTAETMDVFNAHEIANLLLKSDRKFGSDLISIDIQRGRDNGIAPYNKYRFACGLQRASNFSILKDVMSDLSVKQLESKYSDVDDIDLFVGAMMENLIPGTLFGPTFHCLISEQFKRWRNGDRYYYDFGGLPGSFTKSQVTEIRKVTLSTIFCQNGDNIKKMQQNIFLRPSESNPELPCNKFPKMSLKPWKE